MIYTICFTETLFYLDKLEIADYWVIILKMSFGFFFCVLTLSSIYTHFNKLKQKSFWKTWKKVKLLILRNFTFFHNVFYAICILKSFNSHISVCSSFEFGTGSKWCIREWVKGKNFSKKITLQTGQHFSANLLDIFFLIFICYSYICPALFEVMLVNFAQDLEVSWECQI